MSVAVAVEMIKASNELEISNIVNGTESLEEISQREAETKAEARRSFCKTLSTQDAIEGCMTAADSKKGGDIIADGVHVSTNVFDLERTGTDAKDGKISLPPVVSTDITWFYTPSTEEEKVSVEKLDYLKGRYDAQMGNPKKNPEESLQEQEDIITSPSFQDSLVIFSNKVDGLPEGHLTLEQSKERVIKEAQRKYDNFEEYDLKSLNWKEGYDDCVNFERDINLSKISEKERASYKQEIYKSEDPKLMSLLGIKSPVIITDTEVNIYSDDIVDTKSMDLGKAMLEGCNALPKKMQGMCYKGVYANQQNLSNMSFLEDVQKERIANHKADTSSAMYNAGYDDFLMENSDQNSGNKTDISPHDISKDSSFSSIDAQKKAEVYEINLKEDICDVNLKGKFSPIPNSDQSSDNKSDILTLDLSKKVDITKQNIGDSCEVNSNKEPLKGVSRSFFSSDELQDNNLGKASSSFIEFGCDVDLKGKFCPISDSDDNLLYGDYANIEKRPHKVFPKISDQQLKDASDKVNKHADPSEWEKAWSHFPLVGEAISKRWCKNPRIKQYRNALESYKNLVEKKKVYEIDKILEKNNLDEERYLLEDRKLEELQNNLLQKGISLNSDYWEKYQPDKFDFSYLYFNQAGNLDIQLGSIGNCNISFGGVLSNDFSAKFGFNFIF